MACGAEPPLEYLACVDACMEFQSFCGRPDPVLCEGDDGWDPDPEGGQLVGACSPRFGDSDVTTLQLRTCEACFECMSANQGAAVQIDNCSTTGEPAPCTTGLNYCGSGPDTIFDFSHSRETDTSVLIILPDSEMPCFDVCLDC